MSVRERRAAELAAAMLRPPRPVRAHHLSGRRDGWLAWERSADGRSYRLVARSPDCVVWWDLDGFPVVISI